MKIMILGASGMLGHMIFHKFIQKGYDVVGVVRKKQHYIPPKARYICNENFCHENILSHIFTTEKPDVVYNCVGIIKQKKQAQDPIYSIKINSLFPHQLNNLCIHHNAKLIHFSTDCVFSGQQGPYHVDDTPNPIDLYGQSKWLGEVPNSQHALTIRTSIIGHEYSLGSSLLSWVLKQKNQKIEGYTNATFTGVTTNYLADYVQDIVTTSHHLYGLHHVASEPISKFDLIHMINQQYHLGLTIKKNTSYTINRCLIDTLLHECPSSTSRSWQDMIDDMHHYYLQHKGTLYDY